MERRRIVTTTAPLLGELPYPPVGATHDWILRETHVVVKAGRQFDTRDGWADFENELMLVGVWIEKEG